jgi:hypothetical protein
MATKSESIMLGDLWNHLLFQIQVDGVVSAWYWYIGDVMESKPKKQTRQVLCPWNIHPFIWMVVCSQIGKIL